eukprot:2548652-Rhodomonas_salina.1
MTSELLALGGQDGAGLAGAVGEWVWRSNRAWLSLLGPRQRLPAFNTPLQFVVHAEPSNKSSTPSVPNTVPATPPS